MAAVKGGMLALDKGTTVGGAVDHYKYFGPVAWSQETLPNGKLIVKAVAPIATDKVTIEDVFPFIQEVLLPNAKDSSVLGDNEKNTIRTGIEALKKVSATLSFQVNQDSTFELGGISFTDSGTGKSSDLQDTEVHDAMKQVYDNKLLSMLGAVVVAKVAQPSN